MAHQNPVLVLDSVVKILGGIQTLTNNWCEASDAYKDFPGKVAALCTALHVWKKGVEEFGLSRDETLVKLLEEPEILLKKEEKKLLKRIPKEGTGRAWGFVAKLKMTVLPGRIDKSVNRIKKALDDILKNISDEGDISAALEKRTLARKPTLGFQRDKRYVRLQATEQLVRMALTQPGDPKVVLLYGGPGKGKSCLARDIALQIEPSVDGDSSQQSDLGASSSTDPQLAETFDKVIYIECGREAQISTIQLDLLQKLGRGAHPSDDQKAQLDSTTQSILKGLLQSQKILIIFDDVWIPNVVKSIIDLCGKNVKCLLTTQIPDLCRPLNCTHQAILMENIDPTCARKILASHVLGHQDGRSNIPEHLEGLADKIIQKVDANPLAMACVATGIDRESFEDERVWQKAVEGFLDSLGSKGILMIHNSEYTHSFWVSMQQSIERLTKEENKLFIIVSLCRGPSVPEEVVEYLYKLQKVDQLFLTAKRNLANRQLMQIRENSCSIPFLLQEFVDRKLQIDKYTIESQLKTLSKNDGKKGISDPDQEVDPDILKAIISLYLSGEIALTVDGTTDASSALDGSEDVVEPITRLILADTRGLPKTTTCSYVREIFLTYMKSGSIHEEVAITILQSSNPRCIAAVTNMLVRFAQAANNNDSVGAGVVYALLRLMGDKELYKTVYSTAQNDLLSKAAEAVRWLHKLNTKHGKAFVLKDTTLFTRALQEIKHAMAMDNNPHLQHQAELALGDLSAIPNASVSKTTATPKILGEHSMSMNKGDHAKDREHPPIISGKLSVPGDQHLSPEIVCVRSTLQGHVSALIRDDNPHLQVRAAQALAISAYVGGTSTALTISYIPESLERLVRCLTKASNPQLQIRATEALGDLALRGGQDLCIRISSVPRALEELFRALEMDTSPNFQSVAARALAVLAYQGGPNIALRISCIPQSLGRLVHSLTKASNPQLQRRATEALGDLALRGGQDLCIQISSVPRALEELVCALEMDPNPDFQAVAARALAILAYEGGSRIALRISCIRESMERLVRCLTKASNPQLQRRAAEALGDLALRGGQDLCIQISSVPRALEELVCALEMDTNPDFQAVAARALAVLACQGGSRIALRISCIRESIGRLVRCLTKASNPQLQKRAAEALGVLALRGGEDLCMQISSVRRALEELVLALEIDTNPDFQALAARALATLAYQGGSHIALRISWVPESMGRLVHSLTKSLNPELQRSATEALGNLALRGGQDLCTQISDVPRALQELVHALEIVTNPDFQALAARALAILADQGGPSIALRISCIPESLERLVRSLTKESNPQLQRRAAEALGDLALRGGQDLGIQMSNVPRAMEELVCALEMDSNPDFQAVAARALAILADQGGPSIALRIFCIPESLQRLVRALTKASNPQLQQMAGWVLTTLAFEGNHHLCERNSNVQGSFPQLANALERSGNVDGQFNLASRWAFSISATCNSELQLKLAESPGLIESLVVLANDSINSPNLDASARAIGALTLIDPPRGQEIVLNSAHSYQERGRAELLLGLYKESLKDLSEAWRIQPPDWDAIPDHLSTRITVKVRLNDLPGALADANSLIEVSRTSTHLQERGVLRCMMDDLPGALKDLDEALNLDPNTYECLKHRGYVKFLLQDEAGARADAEKASEIKPPRSDFNHYGRRCLGESSVKYMGYCFR